MCIRDRAKVNPPLRTADDCRALLEALRTGLIDIIATDHAPHRAFEKAAGLRAAPCGIAGLETAVPLLLSAVSYTHLDVYKRQMAEEARDLLQVMEESGDEEIYYTPALTGQENEAIEQWLSSLDHDSLIEMFTDENFTSLLQRALYPVSYTHLDVYKRQP